MPAPKLFKADDGSVQEVVESKTLTLDEIDERIAGAQEHVAHLQQLRDNFVALESGTDTTVTPAPVDQPVAEQPAQVDTSTPAVEEQPAVAAADGSAQGGVELTVTPGDQVAANADQGQAPAVAAVDAPVDPTAAVNNGQVDPAAASNPTPAVPDQPIVGA